MKLKALNPRLFNVMFHAHTVTGIVISFGLFIIFYTGAFTATLQFIDNDIIKLSNFKKFTITPPSSENPFIQFFGVYKKPQKKNRTISYSINPHTKEFYKNTHKFKDPNSLTYMGDTLYRLHYFRPLLPKYGIYLAGLVAFFFLFAIITGVLTHWKNILHKFYDFRVKGKWKQIWTNTHTVIGTITLPFQITYAITGALIGISILLLAPSALLLFDGDRDEIIKLISPNSVRKYNDNSEEINSTVTINNLSSQVVKEYPNHHINKIKINNYGKKDGTILFEIDDKKGIAGDGELLYNYKDGALLNKISPSEKSYTKGTYRILLKLHYARFGGYLLKIIYFILAMLTCYVITSGVMIWKTARETSKYTDKQKRFHHRVTKFYLAFTSSLFPAIALLFIANKIFPIAMEFRVVYVKRTFYIGWLLLTLLGLFWNNYGKLHRNFLLMGSILALLIPVFNGVITGDWFWKTFPIKQYFVFCVDFTWALAGIIGLIIHNGLNKKQIG